MFPRAGAARVTMYTDCIANSREKGNEVWCFMSAKNSAPTNLTENLRYQGEIIVPTIHGDGDIKSAFRASPSTVAFGSGIKI